MKPSGRPADAATPPPRSRAAAIAATLALLAASITLSLFLAEGVVRLLAPQALILIRPDIWMPAEGVGWKNRPNVNTHVNTGERDVHWSTDARGFRTGAAPVGQSEVNLLALGDSFLAAEQVEDGDTMVRLLEERLSSRTGRRVSIWNSGVAGWNPNHYRIELQRVLDTSSPDGVLVFIYLGNDIIENVAASYPPRQPDERHHFRWPRSLALSDWVEALGYPVNDFLEVRSQLFIFARTRLKYLLMRLSLTPYTFPETLLARNASSPAWETTAGILQDMRDAAGRRGIPILFVLIPSEDEADPAEARRTAEGLGVPRGSYDLDQPHVRLGQELARRGLTVFDATGALRTAIAHATPDVYGHVDNHLGKAGHRVMAEAMETPAWEAFFPGTPDGSARPEDRITAAH
ncbi:MAG TPA: hypothetical protein VGS03_01485 [Candidatus Polarisedimenticolia bacterium]|nr:hypothetical protein [Candidatus Polarisedimenticolia bacterium]